MTNELLTVIDELRAEIQELRLHMKERDEVIQRQAKLLNDQGKVNTDLRSQIDDLIGSTFERWLTESDELSTTLR